jgi:hypothetical protein
MVLPTDYLRLAVDPIRLAILGRAAVEPVRPADLAGELGVSERRVRREVGRLVESGLLTPDLRLDASVLQEIARALPQDAGADPAIVGGPWSDDEARTLARFFSGSRITEIPAQAAKRTLVLERLVQEFEPGLRYTEREVNSILQVFHPDYAALRRYLVDGGFLARADGSYWRTGGRMEPP